MKRKGLIRGLGALVLLSAGVHLWAEYTGQEWAVFTFKPLTVLLIMAVAGSGEAAEPRYRRLVLLGLGFSLAGDVLLMLPVDLFLPGLAAFLLAHVVYILAFLQNQRPAFRWPLLLALLMYGAGVLIPLLPGLGSMTLPVLLYMLVILSMAYLAVDRWRRRGDPWSARAALGAGLFVLSDSLLALNRFRAPFPAATAAVLVTYYLAQWLIARSTAGGRSPAAG